MVTKKENILITGGAGYVGSHVADRLASWGYRPIIWDNLSTGWEKFVEKYPLYVGDVGDMGVAEKIWENHEIQGIIHCAGSIVSSQSFEIPLSYYQNNVENLGFFLGWLLRKVGKNVPFLFSSSASVYAPVSLGQKVHENSFLAPISPYGRSKLMGEWLIEDVWGGAQGTWGSLRYFNVAGASSKGYLGPCAKKEATHILKKACQVALGRLPYLPIYGMDYPTPDGTPIRDYIHVEDLADLHLKALEYLLKNGGSLILNGGYSRGFSVMEILQEVENQMGQKLKTKIAPHRKGDVPYLVANADKAKTLLHWEPQWDSLEKIVNSAIVWEKNMDKFL